MQGEHWGQLSLIRNICYNVLEWVNPALVKAAREDHIEAYEKLERRDMIEEENGNIRIKVDLVRRWLVKSK